MTLSRRGLLTGAAALASYSAIGWRSAHAASGQFWGAIRWPAWWANSVAAQEAQGNLWPSQWQSRAPVWAEALTANQLKFAPGQAQMDNEIRAASAAGLKYWAYIFYPVGDANVSFMNALVFHRASAIASQMPYCLILQLGHWGGTTGYSAINAAIVQLALDSYYMKVSTNPVIFLDWDTSAFASQYGSSNATVKVSLDDLRAQMIAAGLQTPYVIVQFVTGAAGFSTSGATITAIGADALGAYFHGSFPSSAFQTYASYDLQVQGQWTSEKNQLVPVVPTLMVGFDGRPRVEQPVPFVNALHPYFGRDIHVVAGTPTEVATHAAAGVAFINSFPATCPQKLGLIYSWDENDEFGGMNPTKGDPTGSILVALGAVIA